MTVKSAQELYAKAQEWLTKWDDASKELLDYEAELSSVSQPVEPGKSNGWQTRILTLERVRELRRRQRQVAECWQAYRKASKECSSAHDRVEPR
jgi:hypothetical protein